MINSTAPTKSALVCGAGGFIGSHLVKRLSRDGFWVRGVDLKKPEYSPSSADEFIQGDLRDPAVCKKIFDRPFDEVYQLAADMGGAGYIFTGDHDADVMHNSAQINLNALRFGRESGIKNIFFSSSACIYPERNQLDPDNPNCAEDSAYPADPDSEYGWEKIFGERLFLAFHKNYGLNVRIARFHNIFGPEGSWNNGKESHPPQSAGKLPRPKTAEKSKCGETAPKPDRICILTSAWRVSGASWTVILQAPSTSDLRKW